MLNDAVWRFVHVLSEHINTMDIYRSTYMYMRTVELARQTLEERQRESTGESPSVACSLTSATTALGESAHR